MRALTCWRLLEFHQITVRVEIMRARAEAPPTDSSIHGNGDTGAAGADSNCREKRHKINFRYTGKLKLHIQVYQNLYHELLKF